jgi:hypothetical protein
MKQTISFFVFLLLIHSKCFSQNNFQKGYIISNNNDTIFGLIKYGSNYENTYKCSFKAESNSPVINYLPGKIIAYRFDDGKYFISKKINSSDTSTIFLEFLFDGIVDLYDYFDKEGVHYLISKSNNTLQELKNDTRISIINGVTYKSESKEYIGLLKTIFFESPTLIKKTESLSLNINPLIQLAEEYHREVCPNNECIIYAKKRIKPKISPVLIAGYSTSDLLLRVDFDIMERIVLPPLGRGFRIGALLNIEDEFISRNLSVQTGISITESEHYTSESNLHITILNFPVQLRFSRPIKTFEFSVLGGFNYNNLINFDYTSTLYGNFELKSNKKQVGFIGGMEVEYKTKNKKSILLQIRYENNSGEHIGQWSGNNYGQWNGMSYDPEHSRNVIVTKDTQLLVILGFQL